MDDLSNETLLRQLWVQLSSFGCHTVASCPLCGEAANGGAVCAGCLSKELRKRRVPESVIEDMRYFVKLRDEMHKRIDTVIRRAVSK